MKHFSKTGWLLLILISIFGHSCNPVQPSPAAYSRTPAPVVTIQSTAVPASQTPVPPSPTVTSTPTPVWTPLSTLSTIEAAERVWHLYETNGGCEYPCWWGIKPGETKARSAIEYLKSFAFQISIRNNTPEYLTRYDIFFPIDEYPTLSRATNVTIYIDPGNDSIDLLEFGRAIDVRSFFEKYGIPEQIYLMVGAIADYPDGDYEIYSYYPDFGMMAGIAGTTGIVVRNNEKYMVICEREIIEDVEVASLSAWSPHKPFSIEELLEMRHPENPNPDQPLQETSNMSIENFYNMVLGKPKTDICLEIEMRHWGYTP